MLKDNTAKINWYPGHMTKTRRMIEDCIKQIDVVVELVDARIPLSSKNPDIAKLCGAKPKFILLNKCDLANPAQNKKWLEYYKNQGYNAALFDSKNKKNNSAKIILNQIRNVCAEKIARDAKRGMSGKAVKIMVLGIPNVGKSTFINCISGSNQVRAEDRPGVTRGKQWISLPNGVDLLDTPGILWPKIEDQTAAVKLAITGAIKDQILDIEGLAMKLLSILKENYAENLKGRYKLTDLLEDDFDLLCAIGKKRGFVVSGGQIDTERAATILLDEFRAGKIGTITLDIL